MYTGIYNNIVIIIISRAILMAAIECSTQMRYMNMQH